MIYKGSGKSIISRRWTAQKSCLGELDFKFQYEPFYWNQPRRPFCKSKINQINSISIMRPASQITPISSVKLLILIAEFFCMYAFKIVKKQCWYRLITVITVYISKISLQSPSLEENFIILDLLCGVTFRVSIIKKIHIHVYVKIISFFIAFTVDFVAGLK